jgi:hypothetical protein
LARADPSDALGVTKERASAEARIREIDEELRRRGAR